MNILYKNRMYIDWGDMPPDQDGWVINGVTFLREHVEMGNQQARDYVRIQKRLLRSKLDRDLRNEAQRDS